MRNHNYCLVRTAFHGGGIISRHKSLYRAEQARRKYASEDCNCGCARIVKAVDVDDLPQVTDAKYWEAAL